MKVLHLIGISLLAGCAAQNSVQHYVPANCHGVAEPFSTFSIEQINMPGFIQEVMEESVSGALTRLGLEKRSRADNSSDNQVDLDVKVSFELIDRNAPVRDPDPFAEPVATSQLNRFIIHVDVDVFDTRSTKLIWTGSMNRAHAIEGGETFHNDRAVLEISSVLDTMFEGLTNACE
jgi:hypothetical protein